MTEKEARAFRKLVEQGSVSLSDAQVSTAPDILPRMQYTGELIKSGTRINWNGTIKRAAVDLWATEENDPDHALTLWEDILYKDGVRIIPEVFTVGLSFGQGELGYWKGDIYKSLISSNVWTPEAYPAGWERQ